MAASASHATSDSPVQTARVHARILAARLAPEACENRVPRKDRGRREDRVPATAPTAPAQRRLRERALTTGTGGNHAGLPCAVALRLIRALPGEPCVATVALAEPLEPRENLTPAWARQNHTTSPYASVPLVERHLSVHRIPARVRDDRDTPLDSGLEQNVNIEEDWERVKTLRALLGSLKGSNDHLAFLQVASCKSCA